MEASRKGLGKIILQAAIGGLVGYSVAYFGARSPWFDQIAEQPGALALAGVGLIYLLIGLFVGLAGANPQISAAVLNVADVEDARAQRPVLVASSAVFVAFGAAQLLLAMAATGVAVPPVLAISATALALTMAIVLTWLQWSRYDELLKLVSWESGAFSLALLAVLLLVWAIIAEFGSRVAIDPMGLVALLMGSILVGSFIATGRRGMLNPAA
ncbi:MAG: hypothetical protein ACK442_13980 [Novosphingobium sp.]|jgi:hypothetical protein|nr:hypothetical protein [Brevundimonas sp.]